MKRQIEKLTAEGKTKKKKRYREGWSIDRRNVHSVEEKYNLNVKTIKDETKKKKNSRVSKFHSNSDTFRRLGKWKRCAHILPNMLAETHGINHRRRHWAPFQNRNVTTERPPPPFARWRISNEPDCRFSFFLSFSPPFELHCTILHPETLKNQPLKRKFVIALNGIILRLIDSIEMEIQFWLSCY